MRGPLWLQMLYGADVQLTPEQVRRLARRDSRRLQIAARQAAESGSLSRMARARPLSRAAHDLDLLIEDAWSDPERLASGWRDITAYPGQVTVRPSTPAPHEAQP